MCYRSCAEPGRIGFEEFGEAIQEAVEAGIGRRWRVQRRVIAAGFEW